MARPDSYQFPAGIAIHPWINKADTKFNVNGVFHTKYICDAALPEVQTIMAKVKEKAEERFAFITKDLTPAERKKWKVYVPYEDELDDQTGEPTGRVVFNLKRNWKVKIDGEEKELRVSVYDSKGEAIPEGSEPAIFGGTELSAYCTMRDVKVPGTKQAGVKLDMFAVQVIKLSKGSGRKLFGAVEHDPDEIENDEGYVFKAAAPRAAKPAEAPAEDDGTSEY